MIDTPKEIYHCDFPDCQRLFVRQDLRARHRERHTARGSHLQRKDNYLQSVDTTSGQIFPGPIRLEQANSHFQSIHNQNSPSAMNSVPFLPPPPLEIPSSSNRAVMPAPLALSNHNRSASSTPVGDHYRSPQSYQSPSSSTTYNPLANLNRSNSEGQRYSDSPASGSSTFDTTQRHSSFGSLNSARLQNPANNSPHLIRSSGTSSTSPTQFRAAPTSYAQSPSQTLSARTNSRHDSGNGQLLPLTQFPPMTTASPSMYPYMPQHADAFNAQYLPSSSNTLFQRSPEEEMPNADSPTGEGSFPIFGGDPTPIAMGDEFTAWLFNESQINRMSPVGHQQPLSSLEAGSFMEMSTHGPPSGIPVPPLPPQHSMAVTSILDPALPQQVLSERKRNELLDIIRMRFNEKNHAPVKQQKQVLLSGNQNDENHVLSLRSLQTYIGSYWYHFHPQMPILHKPTFSADRSQNLLLIAVIAIGAACLDKVHGQRFTNDAAELATFLAWHLRGEIFTDADFRPPAKLWVFQALLLLEVYEKMYATRVLHVRAHIHHATTLTLMRRGSSLRGRSAMDSPPSIKEDSKSNKSGESPHAIADTPDQWWNHWITNEATRRVAFAAFIIDSTHATMFGHAATMVAHEMRLPLPCDESLWSATSGVEVGRLEASLQPGSKPIYFLEGLKRILSQKSVRTNSFGRTALMAGLLSVSWHMHQRDMQVRSLGVLGGKDVWRGTLRQAFDYWEDDFDSTGAKDSRGHLSPTYYAPPSRMEAENMFESRIVLHHLAHMAMHVDIVQCQIFAKATRLLGRTITPPDYNTAQKNIKEIWAPKASARDATFFALKFLSRVLMPDLCPAAHGSQAIMGMSSDGDYSARDDFLLNRPWVLYFAALIVWSYGYALDGKLARPPTITNPAQQKQDMRSFLQRVGGIKTPEDLERTIDRNACTGMLMVIRDEFRNCRWELMLEAANLLQNCIDMLRGES